MAQDTVNVVLVDCSRPGSVAERVLWELATRLPRSRFAPWPWLPDAKSELGLAFASRGDRVERVPEMRERWDLKTLLHVWGRLRRSRPALLHLHQDAPFEHHFPIGLADAAGISHVVVSEHGGDAPLPPTVSGLSRRALARADAVTAPCGSVADSWVRAAGVDRTRVSIVPPGVEVPDLEDERPLAREVRKGLGIASHETLWVCPSRLEPLKGHAVLFEALAELDRRGIRFTVALAGDGSLRGVLERRASELGIEARVRFLGAVEEPGPILLAADVVVLPSLWEGAPRGLLAALARDRPVVATAVGGVPEVVEDGVTGRMVPPGDASALGLALETMLRWPDHARRLGECGGARAREEWSWARTVEDYEAVYDEVLGFASFTPAAASGAYRLPRG